mgnify:CR=1 FL=1
MENSTTPSPSKTVRRVAKLLRDLDGMPAAGYSTSEIGEAMGYMACLIPMLSPDEWRAAVALSEGGE